MGAQNPMSTPMVLIKSTLADHTNGFDWNTHKLHGRDQNRRKQDINGVDRLNIGWESRDNESAVYLIQEEYFLESIAAWLPLG